MISQFSDNYYRAELIEALTNSLTPAISINNEVRTVDSLNTDVKLILEEVTRYLNMEKLLPSYRNTITVRYTDKGRPWFQFIINILPGMCSVIVMNTIIDSCTHESTIVWIL